MKYRAYLIPAIGDAFFPFPHGPIADREFRRGIAHAQRLTADAGPTVEVVVIRYPDHIMVRNKIIRKEQTHANQ